MDNLILINLQWYLAAKIIRQDIRTDSPEKLKQRPSMMIQNFKKGKTPTTNNYNGLETDEIVSDGDYKQSWNLDSGTSGHYTGPRTGETENVNGMESKYKL